MYFFQVAVSVLTKAGEGELSDYLVNRTDADKPGSPPRDLIISGEKLPNAVRVSWIPPEKPNGPISKYQIIYGYMDFKNHYVEKRASSNANVINLEGLAFNAEYEIKIRACSKLPESSDDVCGPWGAKKHTTGIGRKYLSLFYTAVKRLRVRMLGFL